DVNIVWEDDNRTSRNITIRDVLYIPEAGDNLISIGMLTKKGINLCSENTKLYLFRNSKSNPLLIGVMTSAKIWKIQRTFTDFALLNTDVTVLSRNRSKQELLHARLGHMGNDQSNKINDMVDGLDRIKIRP
ncbi:hypothetical protein GcM1_059003, partial [Golovinomyces cichoracearum]